MYSLIAQSLDVFCLLLFRPFETLVCQLENARHDNTEMIPRSRPKSDRFMLSFYHEFGSKTKTDGGLAVQGIPRSHLAWRVSPYFATVSSL